MRWEDERYVRVYTRDTLTWKRLGWQGRSVLVLLMRVVDRAGIVEIGDMEPEVALATLVDVPEEVTGPAWKKLNETATVTLRDGVSRALVVPNFIEAQEAVQSGKLRTELWRERRKAARDSATRKVTKRDGTSPTEDVKSPLVTNGDESRRSVTPSLAEPSLAEEKEINAQSSEKPTTAPLSPFVEYVLAEWPDVKNPAAFEARARAAFPAVDPLVEARKARGWELADEKHRKVKHGQFFWNWLGNTQQNANRNGTAGRAAGGRAGAAQLAMTPEVRREHDVPGKKWATRP